MLRKRQSSTSVTKNNTKRKHSMSTNNIVAVVGMCGSGKSVATEMFTDAGWTKVYFGGITMEELERRGLPKNEKNEKAVREELRAQYGLAAYAVKLLDRIKEYAANGNVVLDGLYSWSEYTYLKEALGDKLQVLAIVTDRAKRYSRLTSREIRPLTNEEARSRDFSEIENLEKGGPIAIADYFITNNGTADELKNKIKDYMKQFDN